MKFSIFAVEGQAEMAINETITLLPAPLKQFVEWQGRVIVLLDPKWSQENVLAYDGDGTLLWTIEKFPYAEYVTLGYVLLDVVAGKLWAIDRLPMT